MRSRKRQSLVDEMAAYLRGRIEYYSALKFERYQGVASYARVLELQKALAKLGRIVRRRQLARQRRRR